MLKPSFVRPKLAAIEPELVAHRVGALSNRDLPEVDRCLRRAMDLTKTALVDILAEVDLKAQPAFIVQISAEKSITAVASLALEDDPGADLERLRRLLSTQPTASL